MKIQCRKHNKQMIYDMSIDCYVCPVCKNKLTKEMIEDFIIPNSAHYFILPKIKNEIFIEKE